MCHGTPVPREVEAGGDLEEHCPNEKRFDRDVAINCTSNFHDGRMRLRPNQAEEMLAEMIQHIETEDCRR